jgi:hypothetical protein
MADATDVIIRLQNTRKREYLKYSFSVPYGTLIIFSWNRKKINQIISNRTDYKLNSNRSQNEYNGNISETNRRFEPGRCHKLEECSWFRPRRRRTWLHDYLSIWEVVSPPLPPARSSVAEVLSQIDSAKRQEKEWKEPAFKDRSDRGARTEETTWSTEIGCWWRREENLRRA